MSKLIPLDKKGESIIQNNKLPAMVLFVNAQQPSISAEKTYTDYAETHESECLFMILRYTDLIFWSKLEEYGSKERNFPQLFLLKSVAGAQRPTRYRFTGQEINESTLSKFLSDYRQGLLKKIQVSAPPPPKEKDPVIKTVVASTYIEDVHKVNKDVVVQLYTSAPSCKACKDFEPIFEEVAWEMKKNNNIIFASIDVLENEVPLTVINLPMVYYFKNNLKRTPIHFEGQKLTRGAILEFIRNNMVSVQKPKNTPRDDL